MGEGGGGIYKSHIIIEDYGLLRLGLILHSGVHHAATRNLGFI